MAELIFLIVLGTTIWVGYDASTNKITSSEGAYGLANGAFGWVLVCILLWIIAFPAYLVRRSKVMSRRGPMTQAPAAPQPATSIGVELEKLAALHSAGRISDSDFERAKQKLFR